MTAEEEKYFMALTEEWIELRERFYKTKSKEERHKIRSRKNQIDAEQEALEKKFKETIK